MSELTCAHCLSICDDRFDVSCGWQSLMQQYSSQQSGGVSATWLRGIICNLSLELDLAYRNDKLLKQVCRPTNDFVLVSRQLGPLTLQKQQARYQTQPTSPSTLQSPLPAYIWLTAGICVQTIGLFYIVFRAYLLCCEVLRIEPSLAGQMSVTLR